MVGAQTLSDDADNFLFQKCRMVNFRILIRLASLELGFVALGVGFLCVPHPAPLPQADGVGSPGRASLALGIAGAGRALKGYLA